MIQAELTNVWASLMLLSEVYIVHERGAGMTKHGYKELHLGDCARREDEGMEYAERHDDES